jgi:hypothetical protein
VDEDPLNQLLCHSITHRIALGSLAGRKVFTLQTVSAIEPEERFTDTVCKVAGFSLHAGVAAKAHERKNLERLCRYISRPAVSEQRLSLTPNVPYQLKTPCPDGTAHVIFEPLDFMAKLAALVPKPMVNLTRFHGVFAPNSKHRAAVTPAKRVKGNKPSATATCEAPAPSERRAAMTWAQRLKRVFGIDIETCPECLDKHEPPQWTGLLPESRAPPAGVFG